MESVVEILEQIRSQIADNLDGFGITTTGRTRDSLKVETYEEGARLIADGSGAPMATTEIGSPPHFAPIEPLKEWARLKLGDERAAYAVQKKIAREGTERHQHPRYDVYTEVVERALPEIEKAVGVGSNEILANINKQK